MTLIIVAMIATMRADTSLPRSFGAANSLSIRSICLFASTIAHGPNTMPQQKKAKVAQANTFEPLVVKG